MRIGFRTIFALLALLTISAKSGAHESAFEGWDDGEEFMDFIPHSTSCKKATASQKRVVNRGNAMATEFLTQCVSQAGSEYWCQQVMRPNPESFAAFQCTYGPTQVHQLINPDRKTWKNAIKAVQLVVALEKEGVKPCLIYNWWRPEPYNQNVGGAPGRHPKGTSVDVRFCSLEEMEQAFLKLCSWRAAGRLRALGYYGTTGLHVGVGDTKANTWGKACPN